MTTISYHTVNGSIRSTGVASVTTAVLTDALGSTTRTESIYGGANFRYTPYGVQIKSTPGYLTPYFGWGGSLGYRETNVKHIEQYVRARHYSQIEARWTSPSNGGSYSFSSKDFNNTVNNCDLSSVTAYRVPITPWGQRPSKETCGAWGMNYDYRIQWDGKALSRLTGNASGWIVQEIKRSAQNMKSCVQNQTDCHIAEVHYWEGWWVHNGDVFGSSWSSRDPNDHWRDPAQCNCHTGLKMMQGWALFFPVPKDCYKSSNWNWTRGTGDGVNGWRSGLYGSTKPPTGWSKAMRKAATYRAICAAAACCKPCAGTAPAECDQTSTVILPCTVPI